MNIEALKKKSIPFVEVDGKVIILSKSVEEYMKADKLSASEFGIAKQVVKDFNPESWKWESEEQLYVKIKDDNSTDENGTDDAEEEDQSGLNIPKNIEFTPLPDIENDKVSVKDAEENNEQKQVVKDAGPISISQLLKKGNIEFTVDENGRIIVAGTNKSFNDMKDMSEFATALAEGIIQSPATKDDYDRLKKAVIFNAGTYLQNIPGYIFKNVTPADVGIDPEHNDDSEAYLKTSVKDLANYLTVQMTKYNAPTPAIDKKPDAIVQKPQQTEPEHGKQDSDASTDKELKPDANKVPEAEAQTEEKVRHVVEESCKEFGLENLCIKITKDDNESETTYFIELAGTEILADTDLTFVKDRFAKVKQDLINTISRIKSLVKR